MYSASGHLLAQWGGEGRFRRPIDVAVDSHGNVYVTDTGASRVVKLSADGRQLIAWKSGPFGDENAATGIAVDQQGVVYVATKDHIQKFSPEGRLLTEWG